MTWRYEVDVDSGEDHEYGEHWVQWSWAIFHGPDYDDVVLSGIDDTGHDPTATVERIVELHNATEAVAEAGVLGGAWRARPMTRRETKPLPWDLVAILDDQGDELAYVGHPIDAAAITLAVNAMRGTKPCR